MVMKERVQRKKAADRRLRAHVNAEVVVLVTRIKHVLEPTRPTLSCVPVRGRELGQDLPVVGPQVRPHDGEKLTAVTSDNGSKHVKRDERTLNMKAADRRLRLKARAAVKAGAECGTARSSHTAVQSDASCARQPHVR